MFDTSAEFEVLILSGGEKICKVRYPSDEQWAQLYRGRHLIERALGRGKVQRELVGLESSCARLFDAIRLDRDGQSFDPAEATLVILKLEDVEPISCERTGDEFLATMRVFNGLADRNGSRAEVYQRVTHNVRMPTQAQLLAYARAARPAAIESRNAIEQQRRLDPALHLWAEVGSVGGGYTPASAVPLTHKDCAIEMVRDAMDAALARDHYDPES